MGFLLILPILVSGFTVCHTHPYFKYKLHRYEGQYLYLQTAKLGFYCFGIAVLIQSFLLWVCNINLNLPLFSETPSYSLKIHCSPQNQAKILVVMFLGCFLAVSSGSISFLAVQPKIRHATGY